MDPSSYFSSLWKRLQYIFREEEKGEEKQVKDYPGREMKYDTVDANATMQRWRLLLSPE